MSARRRSGSRSSARDDVADFGQPSTVRQQTRLSEWARETVQQLGADEVTPRERRRREHELGEDFRERAAIIEYLANLSRADAERAARAIVYGGDHGR